MEVDEEEPTAEAAAGGEEGEAADVVVGEEEPTTAAQIGSQAGRQAAIRVTLMRKRGATARR